MQSSSFEIQGCLFKRDSQGWSANIDVPGWPTEDPSRKFSINIVNLDEFGEVANDNPTEEQLAAAAFFLQNRKTIAANVLAAILEFTKVLEDNDWHDDDFQTPETIHELRELISIGDIVVNSASYDGISWIGIAGNCEWDEEHGLGISLWKDLVLDVGQAELSFSTPEGAWNVCAQLSANDQQRRAEVLSHLAQAQDDESTRLDEEYQASLPDSIKLVQALCLGDHATASQLQAAGVNLNEIPKPYEPAIFMAMNYQDAGIVKAVLDAGARLNVRNQARQTPLEYAEEMLRTMQMSRGLQLGDASAMQQMLAQFGESPKDLFRDLSQDIDADDNLPDDLREMMKEASSNLQGMFQQLAAGFPTMMANATPERASHLQQAQQETEKMIAHRQEIVTLLGDRH